MFLSSSTEKVHTSTTQVHPQALHRGGYEGGAGGPNELLEASQRLSGPCKLIIMVNIIGKDMLKALSRNRLN